MGFVVGVGKGVRGRERGCENMLFRGIRSLFQGHSPGGDASAGTVSITIGVNFVIKLGAVSYTHLTLPTKRIV